MLSKYTKLINSAFEASFKPWQVITLTVLAVAVLVSSLAILNAVGDPLGIGM